MSRIKAGLSTLGAVATGSVDDARHALNAVLSAVGVDLRSPTPIRWMADVDDNRMIDLTGWHEHDALVINTPHLIDNSVRPAAEFTLTAAEACCLGQRLLEMETVWATELDLVVNEIIRARVAA